jgi:hypothetical protein
MTEFEFERILSAVSAAVALGPPERDHAAIEVPKPANDNSAASPAMVFPTAGAHPAG